MDAMLTSSSIAVGSFASCTGKSRIAPVVGMRCRMTALGLKTSFSSRSVSVSRKNRSSRLVIWSSIEDTAPAVEKQDEKTDDEVQTKTDDSDEPTTEISAEEVSQVLEEQTEKSKAVLDDVVNNLKDVLKVQDATKQVYAESAEKAIGVLKDTTEQLKGQAEKARAVLVATAEEAAEKGKENLTMLVENAPDPLLKDIAETALHAHFPEETKSAARIHDFCLGIPYGGILFAGGLLWFLLNGSTAALRFGVFLGGIVLALSVTSLKVWKRGESSMPYITAQGAIATILAVRELRRYTEVKAFFPHALMALLSLGMLAFYVYVFISGGNPPKKAKEAQAA